MVWSMKRKRNPLGKIVKCTARLCAGGHNSVQFMEYWSTYSPVVSWNTVRLVVTMGIIQGWYMNSIDFVMVYPQAKIKTDIYMTPPQVPTNFKIPDITNLADRFFNVYKLVKNLYCLKDTGLTWNNHLKDRLISRSCCQSQIDAYLFTTNGILLVLYVDDAILISPDLNKINNELKSLEKDYKLTDD